MSRCFVGIDPGFTGGIAALIDGCPMPALFDMPVIQYQVTRVRRGTRSQGTETELDTARFVTMLEKLKAEHEVFVMIERAQVRPATPGAKAAQGVVSQAKFFGQFTELRGALIALRISYETVHSATWKAALFHGQTRADDDENESAKEQSRAKAIAMFPACRERLALKKSHGLAEALLIAWYGRKRAAITDEDTPF